jgi:murein DD-endopeptidase MepM/ murein hydrolase activator NlpD
VRKTSSDGGCGVHGYPCVHRGLDMFAESPDVFAPEIGVVQAVSDGRSAPFQGFGPGVILIKGLSGYFHLLSHLNPRTISVRPGSVVLEGVKLAQFDPEHGHTHYEVRKQATGPSETNNINPLQWLSAQQRALVAANAPAGMSPGRKVLVGAAIVGSVGVLSFFALRVAKYAATPTA